MAKKKLNVSFPNCFLSKNLAILQDMGKSVALCKELKIEIGWKEVTEKTEKHEKKSKKKDKYANREPPSIEVITH